MRSTSVAADRDRCLVTVCRGCCCGDREKHPDVDHAAQVAALETRLRDVADTRISDCLLACGHSNVVVVAPSPSSRIDHKAKPVWLGKVLDDSTLDLVVRWVHDGGPGAAQLPRALSLHRATPFGARP